MRERGESPPAAPLFDSPVRPFTLSAAAGQSAAHPSLKSSEELTLLLPLPPPFVRRPYLLLLLLSLESIRLLSPRARLSAQLRRIGLRRSIGGAIRVCVCLSNEARAWQPRSGALMSCEAIPSQLSMCRFPYYICLSFSSPGSVDRFRHLTSFAR